VSVRPRKLAYVLEHFPKISETFVAAELIELERRGEDLSVFAVNRPKEPFVHGFVKELSAPVVYLPRQPARELVRVARSVARVARRDAGSWLRAARTSLWPPRPGGLRRLLQATVLREEMERAGIDHAHAHFANLPARLARLASRMGGPPYSVTAHAHDIYDRRYLRLDELKDSLAQARFVVTVCESNRSHLESALGINERLHVIHNAVDLARLPSPEERRPKNGLILAVARLVETKGIEDLIAACGVLARRGAQVRLRVVGAGPLRRSLRAAAEREGIVADFPGALPHERVLGEFQQAEAFSLPCVIAANGDRDALPLAVLEAMAIGVPVVTTGVAGLPEAVTHERTGLLVPQRDPVALADAIERLLSNPELAASLARGARRDVERSFSLARNAATLRSLFPAAI
jgi:glycosyltransferase involved in cell wall biosynthesis